MIYLLKAVCVLLRQMSIAEVYESLLQRRHFVYSETGDLIVFAIFVKHIAAAVLTIHYDVLTVYNHNISFVKSILLD